MLPRISNKSAATSRTAHQAKSPIRLPLLQNRNLSQDSLIVYHTFQRTRNCLVSHEWIAIIQATNCHFVKNLNMETEWNMKIKEQEKVLDFCLSHNAEQGMICTWERHQNGVSLYWHFRNHEIRQTVLPISYCPTHVSLAVSERTYYSLLLVSVDEMELWHCHPNRNTLLASAKLGDSCDRVLSLAPLNNWWIQHSKQWHLWEFVNDQLVCRYSSSHWMSDIDGSVSYSDSYLALAETRGRVNVFHLTANQSPYLVETISFQVESIRALSVQCSRNESLLSNMNGVYDVWIVDSLGQVFCRVGRTQLTRRYQWPTDLSPLSTSCRCQFSRNGHLIVERVFDKTITILRTNKAEENVSTSIRNVLQRFKGDWRQSLDKQVGSIQSLEGLDTKIRELGEVGDFVLKSILIEARNISTYPHSSQSIPLSLEIHESETPCILKNWKLALLEGTSHDSQKNPIIYHNHIKSSGYGGRKGKMHMKSTKREIAEKTFPFENLFSGQNQTLSLHSGTILSVTSSNSIACSVSTDHTASVLHFSKKKWIERTRLLGHSRAVTKVSIPEREHCVLTSSCDGRGILWDSVTGSMLLSFEQESDGSWPRTVKALKHPLPPDYSYNDPLSTAYAFEAGKGVQSRFIHSDRFIVVGYKNNIAFYKYAIDGKHLNHGPLAAPRHVMQKVQEWTLPAILTGMTCIPRGLTRSVWQSSLDQNISLVDIETSQSIFQAQASLPRRIYDLHCDPDNKPVVAIQGGSILLFDARSGSCPIMQLSQHVDRMKRVGLVWQNEKIWVGCEQKKGLLYDLRFGNVVQADLDNYLTAGAVGNGYIFLGSDDGELLIRSKCL